MRENTEAPPSRLPEWSELLAFMFIVLATKPSQSFPFSIARHKLEVNWQEEHRNDLTMSSYASTSFPVRLSVMTYNVWGSKNWPERSAALQQVFAGR